MMYNENAYYYFFSTVAQTLAAAFGIVAAFYLLTLQRLPQKHWRKLGELSVILLALLAISVVTIVMAFFGIAFTPGNWNKTGLFVYFWFVCVGAIVSLAGLVTVIVMSIFANIDAQY